MRHLLPQTNRSQLQRGVALITVLLVVALVALIAVDMSGRLLRQLQRTTALAGIDEAKWVNIGAEGFAKKVLDQDFEDSSDKTHLSQYWANGENSFPLESGAIFTGELKDMHSCFNLNGVRPREDELTLLQQTGERSDAAKQFLALLELVGIDSYQAEVMTDSLADWLDSDGYVNQSSGAEDSEYQSRTFPYLAANSGLVDKGELRAINGFTQAAVDLVMPYVCVIPASQKALLNVNTVEYAELLAAAFTPNLALSDAQQLIDERPTDGYDSVDDMMTSTILAGIEVSDGVKSGLTVLSDTFLLTAETELLDGTVLRSEALLQQESDDWTVISRRFGGRVERVPDTEASESQ